MFSSTYQGKFGIEVLSSAGKDPLKPHLKLAKASGTVVREYDRTTRGYVFSMEKASSITCIQCPASTRQSLGLTQKYLILQIRQIASHDFSFQVSFLGSDNLRRRLYFSSKFKKLDLSNDLSAQLPLDIDRFEGRWGNVILDMQDLATTCFRGATFASIDGIVIRPCCRMRKVFTLPVYDNENNHDIPTNFEFLKGTFKAENNIYCIEEAIKRVQLQLQTQKENDKASCSNIGLNVNGNGSFAQQQQKSNVYRRKQRSWGAANTVINTPSGNSNAIHGGNLNTLTSISPNIGDSDVSGGDSCFDGTSTTIRTPLLHHTHYDESPFKRTARKHKQSIQLKKHAGCEYLSRLHGDDEIHTEIVDLQDEEQSSMNEKKDHRGREQIKLQATSVLESELEKLPSPAPSRSVDMSQARLSPSPLTISQSKANLNTKLNANQMASRFAAIEISPSTSLTAPSSDADVCSSLIVANENGIEVKASPSTVLLHQVLKSTDKDITIKARDNSRSLSSSNFQRRSHCQSIDSSLDVGEMSYKHCNQETVAYCGFDMDNLRYSRQSVTGVNEEALLGTTVDDDQCIINDMNEMDLSHISHTASVASASSDGLGFPQAIDNSDSNNINLQNNHNHPSTSTSLHLNLEQELDRDFNRDEYDLRDQERLLEACISENETSEEVADVDDSNVSNRSINNGNFQYNTHREDILSASAELDDEVLVHLAARSHSLYKSPVPEAQPNFSDKSNECGVLLDKKEQDNEYYSDSDSEIAEDLSGYVDTFTHKDSDMSNKAPVPGLNNGFMVSSVDIRDKDTLLDSRVFGADWNLDFESEQLSTLNEFTTSLNMNSGDVYGTVEDAKRKVEQRIAGKLSFDDYDPVAAAEAMAQRMDKELAKDMVSAEREYIAKHECVYTQDNDLHLYGINGKERSTSLSTSNIWDRTDMELPSPSSISSVVDSSSGLGIESSPSLSFTQQSSSARESFGSNTPINLKNGKNNNIFYRHRGCNVDDHQTRPKTSSDVNFRPDQSDSLSRDGIRPKSAANKDDNLDTPALDIHGLKIMKNIESRVKQQQKQNNSSAIKEMHYGTSRQNFDVDFVSIDAIKKQKQRLSPTRMSRGTGLNALSDIEKILQQEENDFLFEYGELSV